MATATKEKPAIALDPMVLVQYNPNPPMSDRGQWSETSFSMPMKVNGKWESLTVKPGVQEMPLSQWTQWETCAIPAIAQAVRTEIVSLVSTETDLMELNNIPAALRIIHRTSDPTLLTRWAERINEMPVEMKTAMIDKWESLKDRMPSGQASRQIVFGQLVGR